MSIHAQGSARRLALSLEADPLGLRHRSAGACIAVLTPDCRCNQRES
jgi:hypothetical protein